jgi:hypothetical protein
LRRFAPQATHDKWTCEKLCLISGSFDKHSEFVAYLLSGKVTVFTRDF